MADMTDFEFQRMFRLSRAAFAKLLEKIRPDIKRCDFRGIASSGSAISDVAALGASLRFLAGGSYLDISAFFGLDPANFFNKRYVIWRTIDAINDNLELGMSLDPNYLRKTAQEFASYSNGKLKHCVMAIDGWVCKTRMPTKKEVGQSINTFRNRKCCWAIMCLAGCDARCRFNLFCAKWSGGTHDHLAWETCALKKVIEERLPPEYYVIGDEAFVCTQNFLIPWSGGNLGPWKDSFNYHLSSMRQCIERAFGMLTRRWGIFWRPLNCAYRRWSQICMVAAKLHNFCIDENESMPTKRFQKDVHEGDSWEVVMNEEDKSQLTAEERNELRASGKRRENLTKKLQEDGCLRPLHARENSRAGTHAVE
jgi:hypothetical protein